MATPNMNWTEVSAAQQQKEVTINQTFRDIERAMTETLTKAITDTNTVVLTNTEFRQMVILTLTPSGVSGLITVTVPAIKRGIFAVLNQTGFNAAVQVSGQVTPPQVLAGQLRFFLCDGTAVRAASAGSDNLLGLSDFPDSYAGHGLKQVRVAASETGVEFATAPVSLKILDETADGVQTAFNFTTPATGTSGILIFVDGRIVTTGITVTTTGVTFDVAPANGLAVVAWDTASGAVPSQFANSGDFASRPAPAADNAGGLYLTQDGFSISRSNGAAWQPWGPIFRLTPPVLADFTPVNQGTATALQTKDGIFASAPAVVGENLRLWQMAAPVAPWTITAAWIPNIPLKAFIGLGIFLRDNGTGRVHGNLFQAITTDALYQFCEVRNNTPTSFNSVPASSIVRIGMSPIIWMRIVHDGGNVRMGFSFDGENFREHSVVAANVFLANITHFGWFLSPNNSGTATAAPSGTLISWKVS